MSTRTRLHAILVGAAMMVSVLASTSCEKPRAFGEASSIVVAARPALWQQIQDTVQTVLQPKIFTVRNESTFQLTFQDPTAEAWNRLQTFRQELVIGSADDPWVAEALSHRTSSEPLSPPQVLQVNDVWAQEQLVTVILLPPGGGAQDVASQLEPLGKLLDQQYREYTLARMYVSGHDTALVDTVSRQFSFTMDIPNVYRWSHQDSVVIFRNDNPDPSQLIRQVTVAWRSPIPDSISYDEMFAWRENLAQKYYSYPQVLDTTRVFERDSTFQGMPMREAQAVWANPPSDEFPAGGPFILRAIKCPADGRLYLLDAWLYAPGSFKYQYMLQLEHILNSFRCRTGGV